MTPEQKFALQRRFARAAARVKPLLKFGSDVVEKGPRPGDTWSVLTAKGLALANAAFEANAVSYAPHRELADQEKLTVYDSRVFVEMFFRPGGGIQEQFNIRKVPVPGNETGVEARSSAGTLFLFREEAGPSSTRTASNVFHGPSMESFRPVREGLWAAHPHGIYLSLRKENMWSNPKVSRGAERRRLRTSFGSVRGETPADPHPPPREPAGWSAPELPLVRPARNGQEHLRLPLRPAPGGAHVEDGPGLFGADGRGGVLLLDGGAGP